MGGGSGPAGIEVRDGELPGEPLTEDEVYELGLVDPEWPGAMLGLGIGEWSALGEVDWMEDSSMEEDLAAAIEAAAAVPAPDEPQELEPTAEFLVVDVPTSQAYFVRMEPEEVAALGDAVAEYDASLLKQDVSAALGLATRPDQDQQGTPAGPGELSAKPDVMHMAIRSILPNDQYKTFPWNAMGVAACTGTMIGATTLVTAGHCVVNYGQGNYQAYYTGGAPWTMAINAGQAAPNRCFFQTAVNRMYVPAKLVEAGKPQYDYYAYDYAVISLVQRPAPLNPPVAGCPANPPAMVKQALSDATLLNNSFHHDGYPQCTGPGAPQDCVFANSHYKVTPCGAQDDPGTTILENGVDTTIATNAVTSVGHSGGPYWYYASGGVPKVIGTHVGGAAGGNGNTFNGVFRRFTATSLAQINTWVCLAGPCM